MRVKRNCQIRLLSLLVFVIAALFSLEKAYAQMSDEAVVSYVKSSVKSGMSQQQIASELLSKGVTKEQKELLKKFDASIDERAVKENQGSVQGY